MDNFSQMPNTQIENENTILTSEKRDNLDALTETLKGLIINNDGYHESDSVNTNEAKGGPASDMKVGTHNIDRNKRKVTNTSNRDLQQKLLSNRTLPIINTTIDPRINDKVATSGASPYKLKMTHTMEVIMDTAYSNAQILWTLRSVSWMGGDNTTPGNCNVAVRSPWDNSPIFIEDIGFPPTRRHSGNLEILNKRQSTSPSINRNTQIFDAYVDGKLANDGDSMSIFSRLLGRELFHSPSADIFLRCRMDFKSNAIRTKATNFMDLGLPDVNMLYELNTFVAHATRIRMPAYGPHWYARIIFLSKLQRLKCA